MLDPLASTRTPRIRGSLGRATTVVVAAAALVAGAGLPTALSAQAATLTPQRVGGAPAVPADSAKIADPAGDTALDLSVHLHMRDEEGAKALAAAVADSTSPQYRHYLATGEFAQRFGADQATVAKVKQALKDKGLAPGELQADGLTIPVHTTVAGAKSAFDTNFAGYKLADGTTGFANTAAPSLRGDVAGSVVSVVGLNTLAKPHANHVKPRSGGVTVTPQQSASVAPRTTDSYPQLCQSAKDQLNQRWNVNEGSDYYSASSLASIYGLNGQNDGGAGATVAIFSLEQYSDDAVNTFQACYGTSASVKRVIVDGGPTAPATNDGNGVESALDIDTIVGLAPKANVLVYQGPDAQNASSANVQDTYRRIVTDNTAQVISTSWGICDQALLGGSDLSAERDIFVQAALQGQTVVAASGDDGSSSCARTGMDNPYRLSTDDPSSQPYVTGVGGTTLTGGVASPSETVWNHNNGASGGGISPWYLSNSYNFQAGFSGPGFDNSFCHAPSGFTCRQSPDVSAVADPATGYVISTGANYWTIIGGTSGAAPLWAAIAAHANASGACSGRVGLLNQPLYKAARMGQSPLKDVTVGNNDPSPRNFNGGKYAAAAGYDMATGLGTPKADQVINAVCPPAATFQPLAPSRILDNRGGVAGHTDLVLQVAGQGGVPSTGVSAVVLNITVTATSSWGYLTAYPHNTARPVSSNINWVQGQTIPNLVTVPVGADGKVSLYNGGPGSTGMVADVQGYYSTTESGSQLVPVNPTRIMDTRDSSHQANVPGKGEASLQVTGKAGVPASGVTAAVLNVTVTDTQGGGYLTAYPSGTTRPVASNLNWTGGLTIPNAVIVPVGADGKVNLFNGSPWGTNIVVDIAGYFSPSASNGKFHAAGPMRQLDTRTDLKAPLNSGQSVDVELVDNNLRIPKEAKSVVLNVTVTNTTGGGYLTVWPYGSATPTASNLNWTPNTTIANLVTVPVKDGKVSLAQFGNGTAHVVVDLFGYYSN